MDSKCHIMRYPPKAWKAARQILLAVASSGREIYFRGHSDANWYLESSFSRKYKELAEKQGWPISLHKEEELEKELNWEFRKAYNRIPGLRELGDDDGNEFLVLAQHHGLPTRLLDWTRLPYVATFFAFEGCSTEVFLPERKVCVWALNWDMFELLLYYSYNNVESDKVVAERPHDLEKVMESIGNGVWPRIERVQIRGNPNRRLIYQEGLFTRAKYVMDDIESFIQKNKRYAPGTILTKIVIPGTEQAEVLKELSLMAINPVGLMNDLDGAASTAFNEVVRFDSDRS